MQKISSYLYPNRINIVADVALFPTRWNIVYQNRVKIYQGVDNVLTIDVKNSDQKRIDISEMDLRMIVTDVNGLLVSDVTVTPSNTDGLATAVIEEADLENVTPQFLTFSIYRVNEDDSKTVFYADTQFGAKGNMELVGSIMNLPTPTRLISRFIEISDPAIIGLPPFQIRYYSDAVEIMQANFVKESSQEQVTLDFDFIGLQGEVVVQFTKDPVVSAGTDWITIETFTVASSTAALTKSYTPTNGYNREMLWARVYYTPVLNNTGNIDIVTITL
jgi:hypothetical protein